jgi:hypothetical protein
MWAENQKEVKYYIAKGMFHMLFTFLFFILFKNSESDSKFVL